jgi:hypothetical protein
MAASIDGHASVSREEEAHAVRADLARCVKLTALSNHSTKLETSLDLKGNFPCAICSLRFGSEQSATHRRVP